MSKFVSGIESVLPKSLDYKQMKKSIQRGTRKTVKLFPSSSVSSWSYNGNRVIKFDLPAQGGFLDLKNTVLCFEAFRGSGTTANQIAFNNNIESIINKLEIKTGDGIGSVEVLTDYNLNTVSNSFYKNSHNYQTSIGYYQQGLSTDWAIRNTWCDQIVPNPKGYCINLSGSGVMNSTLQYLPLSLLSMGGYSRSLVIEITLENPTNCMVTQTNNANVKNYEVQNAFMQLELIDCPDFEKELTKKVMSGNMVIGIPYVSQDHWVNTLTANRQGEITFQMNSYNELAQGFRTIFKRGGQGTQIDFTNEYIRPTGIQYYQINVGNKFYPTQKVDINGNNSNAIQLNELLKYYNKVKKTDTGFSEEHSNSTGSLDDSYIIATTFKTWYDSEQWMIDQHEYFLDGIDCSQNNQIVFRMSKTGTDNNTYNLYQYLDYVGALTISKEGVSILK